MGRAQNCCAWARRRPWGRRSHALSGAAFLPVLPKEERMGYQSRKGRYLGVPALEGSERAVGAGLFRHVGGRFGFSFHWALPLWLLARAGRGIAWRAVQAALHPVEWQGVAVRLRCGWCSAGPGWAAIAFRVGGPQKEAGRRSLFRASPPGDIRRRRAWRGSWDRCTDRPYRHAYCRRQSRQ